MNSSIATPNAAGVLRRYWARLMSDPDVRSTSVGLLGVLIFLLLLLLAWIFDPPIFRHAMLGAARDDGAREFSIELAPDAFQEKPPPAQFVETNPEAPENIPDNTTNFGAHNQQVAQPDPTVDGKGDRPALEGEKDVNSTQIVSGQLTQPIVPIEEVAPPPVPEQPVAEQEVAPARKEQVPLPSEEKIEGENPDGFGGTLAKRLENATAVPEHIEGRKDAPEFDGPTSTQTTIDPTRPRPRPQLTRRPQQVRPAIFAENKVGTPNVGVIAHSALRTTYGTYLQQLIDTVQIRWDDLVSRFTAYPVIGSTVTVKFVLSSDGRITQIVNVESTASELGTRACISAITDPAPYKPWTDDMRAILGEEQEMTFTFHYQ